MIVNGYNSYMANMAQQRAANQGQRFGSPMTGDAWLTAMSGNYRSNNDLASANGRSYAEILSAQQRAAADMYGNYLNYDLGLYNANTQGNIAKLNNEGANQRNTQDNETNRYGMDVGFKTADLNSQRGLEGTKYGWNTQRDMNSENNRGETDRTRMTTDTQRYGYDRGYDTARYQADTGYNSTRYGADTDREVNRYRDDTAFDTNRYTQDAQAWRDMYGADANLEGSKYGADRQVDVARLGVDGRRIDADAQRYLGELGLQGRYVDSGAQRYLGELGLQGRVVDAGASRDIARMQAEASMYEPGLKQQRWEAFKPQMQRLWESILARRGA
jgi:hypothetical protein